MKLIRSQFEWVDYLDSDGEPIYGRYELVRGLLPRLWQGVTNKIGNIIGNSSVIDNTYREEKGI
jgi:hypothetical protein